MTPPSPQLHVLTGGKGEERQRTLADLYHRYGGSVYGRCRYLLKDEAAAEDAMQEVFARALQAQDRFRADSSPLTWLLKIATHHCLNQLRAARAPWWQRFTGDQVAQATSEDGVRVAETRDWVRKVLGRFDVETQAAAVHYHVDGMTLEQVAELLGRSVPTIRKRLEHFAATAATTEDAS